MKDNHVYPRQTDLGHTPGMELRDWFAGMVLQASCQEKWQVGSRPLGI